MVFKIPTIIWEISSSFLKKYIQHGDTTIKQHPEKNPYMESTNSFLGNVGKLEDFCHERMKWSEIPATGLLQIASVEIQ